MKVPFGLNSVVLVVVIWISLVFADYRYKIRGPPSPPRKPHYPQFMKKWETVRPQRGAPRPPRPIPMHVPPPSYGAVPIGPPRIGTVPNRNYLWKNNLKKIPEKPFHSSPPISSPPEFDYHIQSNSIPTHSAPIKQLDDKGPIHTIPAPNLSLADKPIVVEEILPEAPKLKQTTLVQIQPSHHYQVTEGNDVAFKTHSEQHLQGNQQLFVNSEIFPSIPGHAVGSHQLPTQGKFSHNEVFDTTYEQNPNIPFTAQELYSLLNNYPKLQQPQQPQTQHQPLFGNNNFDVQVLSQPFAQKQGNVPDYQALLAQANGFPSDATYLQQIQQLPQNIPDQTPFGTFNYNKKSAPSENSVPIFETVNYNIKTGDVEDQPRNIQQSGYLPQIFDNSENEAAVNKVEPKQSNNEVAGSVKFEDSSAYYSSLPNRQAAESLASLQAAGKINNNLMQLSHQQSQNVNLGHKSPLEIYVPDMQHFENFELEQPTNVAKQNPQENNSKQQEQPQEFDDNSYNYPQEETNNNFEDGNIEASEHVEIEVQNSYGSRIRSKKHLQ